MPQRVLFRLGFVVAFSACLALVGFFTRVHDVKAQGLPDHAEVELGAVGSTGAGVPFWLHANRDGLVDPASANGFVRSRLERTGASDKRWDFGYGMEVVGRASAHETVFLPTLYAEGRYGFLTLRAGRKAETIGTVADGLTSGSLGTSRNATPIPQIVLATDGYTPVPWTEGWVEFKGRYADGLLPDDRFVKGAYLHQKTFYVQAGGPSPVQVYGGLVHNAFWGGTSPAYDDLPASFDDYVRTVVALTGAEDAPTGDQIYIQGDHLGIIDAGLSLELESFGVRAYRHFIYEDRDNLRFKSPQDGLFGLELVDERSRWWIDRFVYEHLYTKWQNGPIGPGNRRGGPGGRDDYYNHGTWRSGWTFYGRTVGSPLLTPYPPDDGRVGIANNRVVGHHLGLSGSVGAVDYHLLATYSRNYGRYGDRQALENEDEYRFEPPLEQTSFLVEAHWSWPDVPSFELRGAVGADRGELYDDAVGVRLGVLYHPLR